MAKHYVCLCITNNSLYNTILLKMYIFRSGCGVLAPIVLVIILNAIAAAPITRNLLDTSVYTVSGETRGLEVPMDLVAGVGIGMSSVQLVVNVHTDSAGNVEVQTN